MAKIIFSIFLVLFHTSESRAQYPIDDAENLALEKKEIEQVSELIKGLDPTKSNEYQEEKFLEESKELESALAKPDLSKMDQFYYQLFSDGVSERYFGEKDDHQFIHLVKNNQTLGHGANQPRHLMWFFTLHPSYIVRKYGYEKMLEDPTVEVKWDAQIKGKDLRLKFLESGQTAAPLDFSDTEPLVKPQGTYQVGLDPSLAYGKGVKWAACLHMAPLHSFKCSEALDEIIKLMDPSKNNITALPIIQEVLADPNYTKGAAKAALLIMQKVDEFPRGSKLTPGDLFQDIYQSYLAEGIETTRAENMTWNILAVLSARGANVAKLFQYVNTVENARLMMALQTISMGASVLDSISSPLGHLYSLPKQIKTVANYGKTYHFWMSAFLARRMSLKFGSEVAGREASKLVSLAYQMLSTTCGRSDLFSQVMSGKIMTTNKIRVDLVFAYSGSIYGSMASMGKGKDIEIDIDQTVKNSITEASPFKAWDETKVTSYLKHPLKKYYAFLKWYRTVTPDKTYRLLEKQAGCNRWF
ncbi:MAG: hypothetical protein ACOYL6_07080 [Bacteriovoracaceae bacterium]